MNANLLETISKVNIPIALNGYYSDASSVYDLIEKNKEDILQGENKNETKLEKMFIEEEEKIINPNISTYVSLFITLTPLLDIFKFDDHDFKIGFEDPKFLVNANNLLKNIKTLPFVAGRNVKIFADNINGNSVFICRYLKPQIPPLSIFDPNDLNLRDRVAIEKIARYVSLIPFIDDCNTFEDLPECWCSDYEFLNLKFGDYEEHAILLCNYFNYIDSHLNNGVKSCLALGKGHPEGFTIYVMRYKFETKMYEFWNAKTGECSFFNKSYNDITCCFIQFGREYINYNMTDSICQLKEIGAFVTEENIYINIQELSNPSNIELDFRQDEFWLKFLSDKAKETYFNNNIESIQREIKNEVASDTIVINLKNDLIKYLSDK